MKFLYFFIFIFLLFSAKFSFSQNSKVDSLLLILKNTKQDSVRANIYISLFKETIYSDLDKAIKFAEQGLALSEETGLEDKTAKFLRYLGIVQQNKGDYAKALEKFQKALEKYQKLNNKSGISDSYIDIGLIYWYQSNYVKSIESLQKSLKVKEEINDKNGISICLNNIGNIYGDQKNFTEALKYYERSLKIFEELKDQKGISDCLNNIGTCFLDLKNNDSALVYIKKSLIIRELLSDKNGIAESTMSLGIIYDKKNDNQKAENCYKKSLKIFEELGDIAKISILYSNIGSLLMKEGKSIEAINAYNSGLKIAKETNNLYTIKILYKSLASAYAKINDFNNFNRLDSLSELYQDSIFGYENKKQVSEVSAKFETEKKELQISLQSTELTKQKTVRNYLYGVMGLVLLIVFLMIIAYRTKQKANRQLQILNADINGKNIEIEFKNRELEQHNEEIRAQRDEIDYQKKLVEERNREVMDSIHYAKRIQTAILPSKELLDSFLSDYFVLFRPKDIVSGDFYWAAKRKDFVLLAAADCTGHGVPGAFMSMLGGSFLNEITSRTEITSTNNVLDELRAHVIESLQQKGVMGEQKDGMDMSFCAWNISTNILQFSGAYNPCWIVRTGKTEPELIELDPDKMPIAIYENMKPFQVQEIQLEKGDIFYIFSDGFHDQLGGSKIKKMLKKRFRELLLENCKLPMPEQRTALIDSFDKWRGSYEQIDDVLVIGVKV